MSEENLSINTKIYECQWVYGRRGSKSRTCKLSDHCTERELEDLFYDDKNVYFYYPVMETMRVRG